MISIIAAMAKNRVIGNKNKLPWHLPADFRYFKEKTLDKTIILGFNTFKSIGEKPLSNRKHIILNNTPIKNLQDNCYWAKSIDEALEIGKKLVKSNEELLICGGAQVYKQFLPLTDRLYLTYIHHNFEGDTFFPDFNMNEWEEINREDYKSNGKNLYPYSFVVLDRKRLK